MTQIDRDIEHRQQAMAAAAAVSRQVQRVAVLLGGTSGERPISFASGENVAKVLESEGFTVARIDPAEDDWLTALQSFRPDVVFLALHGQYGEDGTVQGLLDLIHLPYTHSGVLASALAMDKERSKVHYRAEGLFVPASVLVMRGEAVDREVLIAKIGLPCVVKPVCDGSSLGVSIPHTAKDLETALDDAFAIAREVMVEEFVAGMEVTVPVVGNAGVARGCSETSGAMGDGSGEASGDGTGTSGATGDGSGTSGATGDGTGTSGATGDGSGEASGDRARRTEGEAKGLTRSWALPVIEIIPQGEFYDYESKYTEGGSEHIIPARINAELTEACQWAAVRAHEALGCRGVSRTDLIINDKNEPYVIETNTIPGMTDTSLEPESARQVGLEPGVFYRYLLALALE